MEAKPRAWENWKPQMLFSDCYILDGKGNVLLIERKEKGFGFGRICAPGGQIEAGETELDCVIREVREEVGLEISEPQLVGHVNFMIPGNNLFGNIFIATNYSGNLIETDEARPFWCSIESIPYHRMFDDARIWVRHAIEGHVFDFYGIYDPDGNMMSHDLVLRPSNTPKAGCR